MINDCAESVRKLLTKILERLLVLQKYFGKSAHSPKIFMKSLPKILEREVFNLFKECYRGLTIQINVFFGKVLSM